MGEITDGAGIVANLSAVPAATDCYGKQSSELGTVDFSNGILTGTLNKVTEYTGFNASDTSEQSGYYLAFQYDGDEEIKMYVSDPEKQATVDKAPTVNVVFLGSTKAKAQKAVLHLVKEETETTVPMTGITFK